MQKATVKQLAEKLNLSESRIRNYIGRKGAPQPIKEAVSLGIKGKLPGYYDFEEFKQFYNECKNNRRDDRW